jgi:hypothetical protein
MALTAGEGHHEALRALNHMHVGDDVTSGVEHDTRAEVDAALDLDDLGAASRTTART